MYFNIEKNTAVFIPVILLFISSGFVAEQVELINLKFAQPPESDSDVSRTLQSMVKARDISETYATGGLYLMTHYGDREALFDKENQEAIENPMVSQTWRYCSVFALNTEKSVMMGRNWDNQNVGSIIVSLYYPSQGYTSISFSRAIDMGFPLNIDLEQLKSSELGNKLLLAPFYAMDGINEHGLSIAVAGVKQTIHNPVKHKELVFVTYLIRKVLDQTKNIAEAVHLVEKFIPFDLDKNSLNSHFIIVDASGKSVILEYVQDEWRKIYAENSWQVLTNKPVYDVPYATLRAQCWRYRTLFEILETGQEDMDWSAGLNMLQDVSQKGTAWSVIYSPLAKAIYFSVYQKWDTIYDLKFP